MQKEKVLGIDLGTSNSVAAVYSGKKIRIIKDLNGKTIQPSVVSFHPKGTVLVGPAAKKRRLIDPKNTVFSIKRLIGSPVDSIETMNLIRKLPYTITEGKDKQPLIHLRNHRLTPTQISALILKHMKNLAEKQLGDRLHKAVITVPANFNDAQRTATKAAGKLAGLDVIRIINEPTAAALAYGHGKNMDSHVLLYDFGGGTFDVTILKISGEIFEVLATAGNPRLGGDDIDDRLIDEITEAFMRSHNYDVRHNEMSMLKIRSAAESIKCRLSKEDRHSAALKELAYGPGGKPLNLVYELTRESLDCIIADLVERTLTICDEAFAIAEMAPHDIDNVVLVGGSTRIPLVKKAVTDYFNVQPQDEINPDEVVAVGAAIQGASLLEPSISMTSPLALLLDVTPLSLCIGTVGGFATSVIPRNSQLPAERTKIFSTSADYQNSVSIRVCQGQKRRFEDNVYLGELTLSGLRPALRGEVKVEVSFEIDTDGILQVRARHQDSGSFQTAYMKILGAPMERDLEALQKDLPVREVTTEEEDHADLELPPASKGK